jgi:hypothetical protein
MSQQVDSTPKKPEEEFISNPPPTIMLSDSGDELFHDAFGIHPVTSITFKPNVIYYKKMVDENGNESYDPIVPKIKNFVHPYKRVGYAQREHPEFLLREDIEKEKIGEEEKIGGKRRRKTIQKPKRKTRKTRKTRRYKRRNTRKYK